MLVLTEDTLSGYFTQSLFRWLSLGRILLCLGNIFSRLPPDMSNSKRAVGASNLKTWRQTRELKKSRRGSFSVLLSHGTA
jgi:hypothetical protein